MQKPQESACGLFSHILFFLSARLQTEFLYLSVGLNLLNLSSKASQLLRKILISPFNIVDIVYSGYALCRKRCHYQGSSRPQIGSCYRHE